MRFVIVGAGAIGGVIGGRLFGAGYAVTLVARGEHLSRIREDGLKVVTPAGTLVHPIPAVAGPAEIDVRGDEVIVLAVKSQHTADAVGGLVGYFGDDTPIVCAQNGVANEPAVMRFMPHVYGALVICPAVHLEPGTVRENGEKAPGVLDVGPYPGGTDDVASDVVAALSSGGFEAATPPDIMSWKYRKLVGNLHNAVNAICGPLPQTPALDRMIDTEAEDCLAAAGIPTVTEQQISQRRSGVFDPEALPIEARGGSSWQSLQRGSGSVEADYLNGEIVRLGRLHGIPTPANRLLQIAADVCARERIPPGSVTEESLLELLAARGRSGAFDPRSIRAKLIRS